MRVEDRIAAFEKLGNYLSAIDEAEWRALLARATGQNPWFTENGIRLAFRGLEVYLTGEHLRQWTSRYSLRPQHPEKIAVVMAGNIPLAGFHDFLSVLISGHDLVIKLSSKDNVLLPFIAAGLSKIEPRFREKITFADQLRDFDAVIATGSDNSARYFQYYFGKYPHIIRHNRTSCAVLTGEERDAELVALGDDVFAHFGLGCRNVSKIFLPRSFDPTRLLSAWQPFQETMQHHKYINNYDYQKSIMLVNRTPFLDSGFVLLQQNEKLVSPISVVYYEHYDDPDSLHARLDPQQNKIQCIVGRQRPASVPFGRAQYPMLWDYADGIDTLRFLEMLRPD